MLSIITVNLNNAEGLRRTIDSVVRQKGADYEFIVVDGASGDGSLEVIKKNSSAITRWISEPDTGVYSAMNKGIRAARGDYCLFLNSGDWLIDEAAVEYINRRTSTKADVYYAFLPSPDEKGRYLEYPKELDLNFFVVGSINHQNSVINRDCLVRFGLYREDLRIMSDWHFFLKAKYRDAIRYEYMDRSIAYYIHNGMSADPRLAPLIAEERELVLLDTFGELGQTLVEYSRFRNSIYHNILRLGGYTCAFEFCLKAYRYCLRRIKHAV